MSTQVKWPQPLECHVCFGINPLVTTHIKRDGRVIGRTDIPCAMCGSTTERNLKRRAKRGIPWP